MSFLIAGAEGMEERDVELYVCLSVCLSHELKIIAYALL